MRTTPGSLDCLLSPDEPQGHSPKPTFPLPPPLLLHRAKHSSAPLESLPETVLRIRSHCRSQTNGATASHRQLPRKTKQANTLDDFYGYMKLPVPRFANVYLLRQAADVALARGMQMHELSDFSFDSDAIVLLRCTFHMHQHEQ